MATYLAILECLSTLLMYFLSNPNKTNDILSTPFEALL